MNVYLNNTGMCGQHGCCFICAVNTNVCGQIWLHVDTIDVCGQYECMWSISCVPYQCACVTKMGTCVQVYNVHVVSMIVYVYTYTCIYMLMYIVI